MKKTWMIFVAGIIVLIFLAEVFAPEILKGENLIDQELKLTDRQIFNEVLSGKFPISREHSQQLINFLNDNPDKKKQFLFTRGINYEEKELEGVTKILDYEYNPKSKNYPSENIQLMLDSGKVVDLTILNEVTEDGISRPIRADIKMQETGFRESTFKVPFYDLNSNKEKIGIDFIRNKNKIIIKDSKVILEGDFNIEWKRENFKVFGKIEKSEQGRFSLAKGSEFIKWKAREYSGNNYVDIYSHRDFTKPIEVIFGNDPEPKSNNYLKIRNNGKVEIKGENVQTILNPIPPILNLEENFPNPIPAIPGFEYPKITSIMTPSGFLISQTPSTSQEPQTPKSYLFASETYLKLARNPFTQSLAYLPSLEVQQDNNQFTSEPTSSSLCNNQNCRVNTHQGIDTLPVHLRNQLTIENIV